MLANHPEVLVNPHAGDAFPMGVVGQIGSGKTFLVLTLIKMNWKYKFDVIVWISPTYALQAHQMRGILPDGKGIVVFDTFSIEILEIIVEHQIRRNLKREEEKKRPERMLLILDDNGQTARKTMQGDELDKILNTCRHRKITIVQLAQRYTQLSPTLRQNCRYLLLFAEANPLERRLLYSFHGFGERNWFLNVMDQHTKERYSFIGIETYAGHSRFFNKYGYLQ